MAKVVYGETLFGGYIYQGDQKLTINKNHTRAVYTDDPGGDKIIITGENLKAKGSNDDLFSSGTVETVKFQRSDGEVMLTVSKGHFDAEKLTSTFEQDGVWGVFDSMFGGKDQIYGSSHNDRLEGQNGDDLISGRKGDDTIYGGRGDDEMSGGNGADRFVFYVEHKGHDTITDFDINGPVVDHLEFNADIESIKKSGGGADTMIYLNNGATVLLDGVEKADFIDYWQSLV
jgi:Ca2+-binding RTX toxin-like protein